MLLFDSSSGGGGHFEIDEYGGGGGSISHPESEQITSPIISIWKSVVSWIWEVFNYTFTDGKMTFSLLDVVLVDMSAAFLGYVLATALYAFVKDWNG